MKTTRTKINILTSEGKPFTQITLTRRQERRIGVYAKANRIGIAEMVVLAIDFALEDNVVDMTIPEEILTENTADFRDRLRHGLS